MSICTYIEHLNDLNEVGVADNIVDSAHFQHDDIIGASSQAFSDSPTLDKLSPQDVENGLQDKLDECDPVTLRNPLIYAVHTGGNKVPLVSRCATFQSARNVVAFLKRKRFLIDVAWEELVPMQVRAFSFLNWELLILGKLLGSESICSLAMIMMVVQTV